MTDLQEITRTEWDLPQCQCAECHESEIDRSCEPASYVEVFIGALGVLVVASVLAWWGL